MIKQPLTSKEFEVYLNRLAHFAIEYYDNPSAYSVTPGTNLGISRNLGRVSAKMSTSNRLFQM